MGRFYEKISRPVLFRLDSERAHELAVDAMAILGRFGPACRMLEALGRLSPKCFRPVEAFGLRFPNTVGLAAGFDKNARAWPAAAALGFGLYAARRAAKKDESKDLPAQPLDQKI